MNVDVWKFVQDNVFLIAVAVASGGMLVWPWVRRGTEGPSVNTLEATLMINQQDALVLDVREAADYGKAHVLNARNIPLAQLEPRLRELEKYKRKPVIICSENGRGTGGAASVLRGGGFEQVFNLGGGLAAWQQAGLPVEKD